MNTFAATALAIVTGVILSFGALHFINTTPQEVAVGSDINFVGGKTYFLSGSGIASTDTSVILTSFTDPNGTELTMANFGAVGYGTFEPGSSRQEFLSFTGVTQDAGSTRATLTGVTRGLRFVSPYTQDTSLRKAHAGGSTFIISNSPQLFSEVARKGSAESITGIWTYASTSAPTYDAAYTASGNQFVSYNQLNGVVIQGAGTSTESALGLVQLATASQTGVGTASSTAGAPLVIENKFATTTPGVLCTGGTWNCIVATVNGAIPASGTFFNSLLAAADIFTGGLTSTATTTLAGSNVNSNAVVINTIKYQWPSAQGTASTTLVNNGSGVLSWGQPFEQLLDASTTPSGIAGSSVATTTLYSFNVPANTLSTGNVIRVKMYIQTLGVTNAKFVGIEAAYGNASTTMYISNGTAGILSPSGVLEFLIQANGTTASQVTEMNLVGAAGFGSTAVGGESSATLSIDSTQAQKIVVAAAMSNSSASDKFLIRRVTTEILRY